MSVVVYGKRVNCDWPGCQSVGDAAMDQPGTRNLPAGWADLRSGLEIRTRYGMPVNELCSLHSDTTIGQLIKAFEGPEQ